MKFSTFIKRVFLYIPNNIKISLTHQNYKKRLKEFKNIIRQRKLKVCFLNSENSKWVYQSLYDELIKSDFFTPQILISLDKNHNDSDIEKLKSNYEFFASRGMNTEYAFDTQTKKYIPISKFSPDIFFYQEPWQLPEEQKPFNVSKYALCCYSSYGSGTTNGKNEYCARFFKEVWAYFLDNNFVKKVLINHGISSKNLVVTGSIKLDAYLNPINPNKQIWQTNKFRIIYAPHFSFNPNSILKFGTFDIYYKFFMEYAKSHPEIEFIFKPHPTLKETILREKLMDEKGIQDYYSFWTTSENTHLWEKGDYFDMFRTSDLMITDCNSFLTEYLPTQKPLIRLISSKTTGLNQFGEEITKGYYNIHSIEELKSTLDKLITGNEDNLKIERQKCLEKLIMPKHGVSSVIMNYLTNQIKKGILWISQ